MNLKNLRIKELERESERQRQQVEDLKSKNSDLRKIIDDMNVDFSKSTRM